MIDLRHTSGRIVLVCHDGERRAAVEQRLPSVETPTSAIEAMLAVVRRPADAVLIDLDDLPHSAAAFLSALRRAAPAMPVYALVKAEDEPRAHDLLPEGLAGYFVVPGDLARLGEVVPHGA